MKINKIALLTVLICSSIFSCKHEKKEKELKRVIHEKYDVVINYKNSSKEKSKGNFVELFFETGFKNDSIQIQYGDKFYNYSITTDMSMGYADFIELGKLSEIHEISFRVNHGNEVIIKDIEHNLVLVNYIKDSVVQVDFSNKFTAYK